MTENAMGLRFLYWQLASAALWPAGPPPLRARSVFDSNVF
jgi:hypothetical protein